MLALATIGIVVVLALTAGVIGFGVLQGDSSDSADTASGPTHPDAWDPRIAPIAEWVADERDLEFEHPVEVILQPEEEYLAQAAGDAEAGADPDEAEQDQQELEDFVATLRAIGLLHGEVDINAAYSELASEGTLAYYDLATEKVYVRGDELTPSVRVTLAHELTHVLQDQHFDLDRQADPDFAEADGLRAMAEGDATRIEDIYAAEVLTDDEQAQYEVETAASVDDGQEALGDVPPVLSVVFGAPYTLGEAFLVYRERVDGGQPWDSVLRDPPSQEELLDPSAWETDRARVADVSVEAPEGAEVLDETTFDPLTWYLLLASRGDAADALEVVDGWGGDAYVAYRQEGRVCAAMAVVGDDATATDQLRTALETWAGGDPAGAATVTMVDGAVEVRACDPGPEAAATGTVTEDLLGVPSVRADLESSLIETGATADQARCSSRSVFDVVSTEQLTSTTAGPEVVRQVEEAIVRCA